MAVEKKPRLVLLSLEKPQIFDRLYQELLHALNVGADVEEVTNEARASEILTGSSKPAVLVTDYALTEPEYARQRAQAIAFIHNGGTMVFGCQFGERADPGYFNKFFSDLSLPWQMGSYWGSDYNLNPFMSQINTSALAPLYNQKAVLLHGVHSSDAIYLHPDYPGPHPIDDTTEVPAAFRSCGQGKFGYMGDVNGDWVATTVMLAMCGLTG